MHSIAKKTIAIVTMLTCLGMLSPAGFAGATTLAELQALIESLTKQLADATVLLSTLQGGSPAGGTFTGCTITSFAKNLTLTSSGADVKCLQIILNSDTSTQVAASGVGSAGNESTYFGPLTKAAVIKFQVNYASTILTPLGLSAGTGYVGSSTRAKLNTLFTTAGGTTEEEEETPSAAGENKVQLAADNPAASTIAKGAQNVIFMKANFCAASSANTVSKIIISRAGIAADADFSYIKLYDGVTQVGATQALNSTTHKATFSSLNWTIPANSCKVLTLKASIASAATAGDSPKLAINAATDITSTIALDGVFPIESNYKTIAGISTGSIHIDGQSSPSGNVIAGGVDQAVAGFKFTASSTEGLKIESVTVTEVGSSVDTDVSNIKLFYGSVQYGLTAASLTSGKATIDLSAVPLEILAGNSKTLTVYADVGTSIGVEDRTIRFEITSNTDVTAYGTNSGGSVTAYGTLDQGTDTWPQQGSSITVVLGTLTVSQDTGYSPSAQDYAVGTSQNNLIAFKFSTGANEAVRVTQIKLQETVSSSSDSDVSNVTLYDAVTGEVVAGPAGMVSGYVTFGSYTTGLDASGLFDVAKSSYKSIIVKADIPSAANVGNAQLGFQITDPTTYVKADGISSQNDLGASEINGGITTTIPGTAVNHDVIANGTLTVGPSSDTPSASTYAVGTQDITIAKFDLTSTGEDIWVTQFNILFATDTTDTATTTLADSADVNNVRLYDGSTLLGTDTSISSGYANFSTNLTVAKNTTKTLTVVVDVPLGSDADGLQAWIDKASDITAEGKDSGVEITVAASSWSAVNGNVFTMGAPGLVIQASTIPATQTFIKNTAGVTVATIYFTASSTEDLKITKIRIAGDATSSTSTDLGYATTSWTEPDDASDVVVRNIVGNVKIYDGTTQLGTTVPTMTDGTNYDYAEFTGLSLTIPKGTTKAINVVLDINDSASTTGDGANYFYFGVATSSTDVAGSGLNSGTALAASTINIGVNGEAGQPMLFGSSGTLTVSADPDEAISAVQMAGATGVTVASWKFTSVNEGMKISKIKFDVNHSAQASGTSIGYASDITLAVQSLATSTLDSGSEEKRYCFDYSLNDAATQTCYWWWGFDITATTVDSGLVDVFKSASSTCHASTSAGVMLNDSATTSDGALSFYASPAGYYSLEIEDCAESAASNTADDFKLGLKYGGTETVGKYLGVNANVSQVNLYVGSDLKGTSYIDAQESGKVIFEWSSGAEAEIVKGNTIISLKVNLSNYTALTEGSTLKFTLGDSANGSDDDYITAKGASSGTTLTDDTINGADGIASLASEEMWLYSTKPTISLASGSPSGAQSAGTNKEVFRFDVTNANSGLDLNINAIRFTIGVNSTSTSGNTLIWDKTFNLYKYNDLSTIIGTGVSYANATSTDTTGWVTIYPYSGATIGSGSTVTYSLYGNTSNMNLDTASQENLEISIGSDDFYWDDGYAANANKKVSGLPKSGSTLTY